MTWKADWSEMGGRTHFQEQASSTLIQLCLQGQEGESAARIKKFMCLMDSMTTAELDTSNLKMLQEHSRIIRIARGAGRFPNDYIELLGAAWGLSCVASFLRLLHAQKQEEAGGHAG